MVGVDRWLGLVLAILATWRVTHLLAREDGPGDMIARLRMRLANGPFGSLVDCFQCLSLWVALPTAMGISQRPMEAVLTWFAVSGAACLLERIGQQPVVIQPLSGQGSGGTDDGLLR